MSLITINDIITQNNEPRIPDTALARGLGYKSAHEVRRSIDRNRAELETYGEIIVQNALSRQIDEKVAKDGTKRSRPTIEYLLNEHQALIIATLAKTAQAAALRSEMVKTFIAFKNGNLNTDSTSLKCYIPTGAVTSPEMLQMLRFQTCYARPIVAAILLSQNNNIDKIRYFLLEKFGPGADIPTTNEIRILRKFLCQPKNIATIEGANAHIKDIERLLTAPIKYNG